MKNFNEAVNIFNRYIASYQTKCSYEGKKLSDSDAFFLNANPWVKGSSYAGNTGYQRSATFQDSMNQLITSGAISDTGELLDFAIKYRDKGFKFESYIWGAIYHCTGFNQSHIDYFVDCYQYCFAKESVDPYSLGEMTYPGRGEAISILNQAIKGYYDSKILQCLKSGLGLQKLDVKDYGQVLLQHLEENMEKSSNHTIGF